MTGAMPRPNDSPVTGVRTPPPDVVTVAREQRLGELVAMRKGANPILVGISSLVAAAVLFGVLALVGTVGEHIGPRSLQKLVGFVGLFACVFMVGFLVYGVVALVRGARSYYVFTDAFVYRRNSTIRVYRWAELTGLRGNHITAGDDAGKTRDYTLTPQAGKPVTMPLELVGDRDEFIDALIAGMRRHDRPVV